MSLVVVAATLLAVTAKKRSWEEICSCEVQPEAWNGGVLPRADRAQAQAHAVAPIGVDGDQEAATIFFATWGGGLSVHYGQHGQHGGRVWVHNKAYGQLAGWSMVIGKAGREEREGLLHQCCCIVSLLTDPPSKANCKSALEAFFFELLIKLLTSSPLSLVSDLLAGWSKRTQLSDFTHPVNLRSYDCVL